MKDDLDRVSAEPLDPRRVNRAVFGYEDAWWFIGALVAAKRYPLITIAIAAGVFAAIRPDLLQVILGAVK
jgi:hypothetical protein